MHRIRILTVALLFAICACSGGGGSTAAPAPVVTPAPAPNGIAGPAALTTFPAVVSANGVASLTLTAAFDTAGRPAFFYQGQEVAPTIRVNPGDAIHLHFINSLPQFCAVDVQSNSNLHFHGLTSAPSVPGDEVISTNAAPGGAVDYVVQINPDQPPGLYWYHPHPHGLSSYEVGNGMAGAIVIEGVANEVPQTANLRERVIVLGDVPNDSSFSAGEDAVVRRSKAAGTRRLSPQDADGSGGSDPCRAESDATPMINGKPMATIGIRPGETELFRVVNASGHRHFDLTVDGESLQLVAQDGVPLHDYPGGPMTAAVSDIVIPPAGRAEFLVTGGTTPRALVSQCYQSGPGGDADPEVVLGMLADDGAANAATATLANYGRVRTLATSARTPAFYRTPLSAAAAKHTIHFSEDANGFYLDGHTYDPAAAPSIVAQSGTVEEWTLENDSDEAHAFHIHQVHFVVESVNGVPATTPHWYDTFDIPPQGHGASGQTIPSVTKVLIDFRDPVIRGTFLYHCHILDHEDGGMMAKIQVI